MIVEKIKNFIYRIFVKYFLPRHRITIGEYIQDMSDRKYRVEATYYDTKLNPILIAVDEKGVMRSFPEKGIDKVS